MSKSKHIAALIIIAVITLGVILVVQNPDLLSDIWLWIVGLTGPIIGFVREGLRTISNSKSDDKDKKATSEKPATASDIVDIHKAKVELLENKISMLEMQLSAEKKAPDAANTTDSFIGTTINVLRYHDDGETTLGLLFIENTFYCYTLEDTYRQKKIASQTRIPAGTYRVDFNRHETPLTLKYRKTRPWFNYHLQLKDVPEFTGIYIHNGSNHEHTAGCLLVANGILATDQQKLLNNSRVTFEKLYKLLSRKIDSGEKIRIKIENEQWFEKFIKYERAD
ncbi:MAG: DUF5675 family protein [Cyclobacteriaceae bacterium]